MVKDRFRLDDLVVSAALAPNKTQARALIMAGKILVDGIKIDKAGAQIKMNALIERIGSAPRFVSRGGEKLAGALDLFTDLDVKNRIALDIGASTGGFTDCLLQRDVKKVYAVDVGYGQLAWKLREDERVINWERCNFRNLPKGSFPEPIELVVADLSFISLEKILQPLAQHLQINADCVLLIKPQFEVGREAVGSGGVVRDQKIRLEAIERVIATANSLGYRFINGADSVLPGPKGNVEYLAWFQYSGT